MLSRGLISGHWSKGGLVAGDFRGHSPRFSAENLDHNLQLVEQLRDLAANKGISVAQLAIAWVLAQGRDVVPVIGARRRDRLSEALGALDVVLTEADLSAIEEAVPPDAARGERYLPAQMAMLDSERTGA